MSELGQNEGQEQNEKTTFFDSAKISEKKDVEHFSNVEGAEERARAAERARKAAEKEAAEVHAADVRAAAEQMKKAEDKQAGKKGGILGFLFGGWHKWVVVAIIFVVAVLAIVMLVTSLRREDTDKTDGRVATVYEEALKTANYESYNPDYYLGEKVIVDAIGSSMNDEEKALLRIALARYYSDMYGNYGEAIKMLDEIEKEYDFSRSDDCFVVGSLSIIYAKSSENDKHEKYNNRLKELKCIEGEADDGQAE